MLHGWTLKDRVMDEVSEGTQADMLLGLVMGFVFGTLPNPPHSPTHLTNSPTHQLTTSLLNPYTCLLTPLGLCD